MASLILSQPLLFLLLSCALVFALAPGLNVVCLMLWGFYRRLTSVVLPFLLILMTNLIVFGVLGYVGIAVNNMLSVVPLVIVAIAIADSIHVINDMARHLRNGDGACNRGSPPHAVFRYS